MNQANESRSESTIKHHLKKTRDWWKTERAKRIGKITGIIIGVGFLIWLVVFFPYVSTDDARIDMTIVRAAPFGVGGRVIKINVVEGSIVKAGDVLVEIDHRVPQSQYNKAKAKAEFAEKEFRRMNILASQKTATLQSLDSARSNFEIADSELKQAEVILENTYIKSPFDGVVIQKSTEVGNILEPGQTAITVADVDHAWVSANVEETSVGLVKVGQHVSIHVDEGGRLKGHVIDVRAAAASEFALIPSDNSAGNFTKVVQRIPIKVAIDSKPKHQLRVGQSVVIKVRVH